MALRIPISDGDKRLSPPRARVAHAWLNAEIYTSMERDAARYGLHPDEAAALVLWQSVADGFFARILERACR